MNNIRELPVRRFLFTFIFSITCIANGHAQATIDTSSHFIVDSVTGTSTDWSVYIGWSDTIGGSGVLKMDPIDDQEYLRCKRIHPNPLRTDSSLVSFTDSSFTIHTANKSLTYTTLIQDNTPWAEYNGWMDALQLHIVTSIDGKNEIGTLQLIDDGSGKVFYLESGWDGPCSPPLLSPDGKTLVTYANSNYETDQSLVMLHHIRRRGKHYRIELIHAETLPGRLIEDVVWMDNDYFAMACSEVRDPDDSDRILLVKYYRRATLDRKVDAPED